MQRMRAASGIVFAREPVRIALAVPALVMAAHHRRDVPRELDVGEQLDARRPDAGGSAPTPLP